MPSLLIIDEDIIDMRAGPEDIRDPGQGQQGDPGLGEVMADTAYGRGGHDGIADPVGGANKDITGVLWDRRHACWVGIIFCCSLRRTGYNLMGEDARGACGSPWRIRVKD